MTQYKPGMKIEMKPNAQTNPIYRKAFPDGFRAEITDVRDIDPDYGALLGMNIDADDYAAMNAKYRMAIPAQRFVGQREGDWDITIIGQVEQAATPQRPTEYPRETIEAIALLWDYDLPSTPGTAEPQPITKKPVYTITEKDYQAAGSWHRDSIGPWDNGQIAMGLPHIGIEIPAGKNTLSVGITKYAPGRFYDNETRTCCPHEVWQIDGPCLITPDGEEFAPADLIDRIEIEGYRRIWSGAYVAIDDLDWITAGEACKRFNVSSATVRQAINREIDNKGKRPSWARKSGGTWLVKTDEAENRWGNRK